MTFIIFLILFGLQVFILVNSRSVRSQLVFYCSICSTLISTVPNILKLENRRLEINDISMDINGNVGMIDNADMAAIHSEVSDEDSANNIMDITPNNSPFIKIANASVFINNLVILRDINLEFYGNEVIALVGPNGSGKSVFFKFLLGFLRHSGDVFLNGKSVDLLEGAVRSRTGYCPASPSVVSGTVLENLTNMNK